MVGNRKSPEATTNAYLAALFEAFRNEPAKYEKIEKLLEDIRYHRVDLATGFASVKELLKDHSNLLIGLKDFLPAQANIPELTMNDSRAYIAAVKETFKDEPEKYKEFLRILQYVNTHREETHYYARVAELMKDHPNLLHGFSVFIPETAVTIPLMSNIATREFSYITDVKEAFHVEPARYTEFIRLLSDYRDHRVDVVSLIARVDELMKDHPNLLPGFAVFLPAETEQPDFVKKIKEVLEDGPANYEEFKKILNDFRARSVQQKNPRAYNLVAKVKERFQGDKSHVYKSFLQLVRMLREGNMLSDKVYHEIVTLLKDHQDLVMEFSDFFNN